MRKKAFTIVELLVVISIIGTLMAITLVGIQSSRAKAKITKAKGDVGAITLAAQLMYSDTRQYPGGQSSLQIADCSIWGPTDESGKVYIVDDDSSHHSGLRIDNTGASVGTWKGPYYNGSITDPWGGSYYFTYRYVPQRPNNSLPAVVTSGVVTYGKLGRAGSDCDDVYSIMNSQLIPPVCGFTPTTNYCTKSNQVE